MNETIQLNNIVQPPVPDQFKPRSVTWVNSDQINLLISSLTNTNPPIIELPSGKSFEDVTRFIVRLVENNPSGAGFIKLEF